MVNKLLSEKIDHIHENNIEKIIDSKLGKIEAILEKQVAEKKSYARVTNSQPSDFKSIMKMAKIEEVSEERDCRSRTSNIIVHGVKEEMEEEEESTSRKIKYLFLICSEHWKRKRTNYCSLEGLKKKKLIKIVQ